MYRFVRILLNKFNIICNGGMKIVLKKAGKKIIKNLKSEINPKIYDQVKNHLIIVL